MKRTQSDLQQVSLPAPRHRFHLLALAVCMAWGASVTGDFVWLDHAEIKFGQARILDSGDFGAVWTQSLEEYLERNEGTLTARGGYFRPLYCLSLSLDWWLGRNGPAWFHIENLLWHTFVTWLLYRLGCALFEVEYHGEVVAFWAALAFAVHPMCSQSVAWICGRKDLLCATFGLSSLMLFVGSQQKRTPSPTQTGLTSRDWLPVLASPLLLGLAILSKELGFVVPVVAALWFWFRPETAPATRRHRTQGADRDDGDPDDYQATFRVSAVSTRGRGFICLVLLWTVAGAALVYRTTVITHTTSSSRGGLVARLGLGEAYPADSVLGNVEISAGLLATYARRSLLPFSPTIVDRWPTQTGTVFTLTMAAIVAVGLVWVVRLFWHRSLAGFAGAWFVVWMLPATGLIPLRHLYAERYLYPAVWGPLAIVALLFFRRMPVVSADPAFRRKRVLAFGFVVFLGAIAFDQTKYWQSDADLFGHALQQDSKYVEGNIALARNAMDEPGDKGYQSAVGFAQRAIDSWKEPGYQSYGSPFINYNILGLAHYYQGQHVLAKDAFQEAVVARPRNVVGHFHLGQAAMGLNDLAAAEQHFETALKIQPGHFLARSNLGVIYLRTERWRDAVEILNPLVLAEPDNPTNRLNLGNAFLLERDFQRAAFHFEALTTLAPTNGMAVAKLAWAQWRQGKRNSALKSIKHAADLDRDDPVVRQIAKQILDEEIQNRIYAGSLRPARKPEGSDEQNESTQPEK